MRNLLRTLASVEFKTKLSSSWGEQFDDGWMVELVDIDLDYSRDIDYSIEDTHFPETRAPFIFRYTLGLTFTLLNFHLDLSVGWERP